MDILSSVFEILPNPIAIARLVAAISPAFNAVKKYADAAVVKVTAEIVSKDVDRGQFLDKIDSEDLAIMVASLRKSLGLKNGRSGGDDCGNKALSKKNGRSASEYKSIHGTHTSVSNRRQLSDSEIARYLERRPHGVYRFRFWVPRSLQKLFGQSEVRKTLKTKDLDEAVSKTRPILEGVYQRIAELSVVGFVG